MVPFKAINFALVFAALTKCAVIYPRSSPVGTTPACDKADAIVPSFKNSSVNTILFDSNYKNTAIQRLAGAVQIPTIVGDSNPDPSINPKFYSNFTKFHKYLNTTFPLIHERLKLNIINSFGLLYTWEGSNSDLKPILFTAHQDVVPVNNETIDEWEFPPFSGHYDNDTDTLWGRGSFDAKNLVIGQMEAVEKLLEDGFQTDRTVLLAYGFDEEASGTWGAKYISNFVEKEYGKNGVMVMFDEGPGLVKVDNGTYLAVVPNAEKGYLDAQVVINGQGGHSSSPPAHTTIGVAADMITQLEKNPSPVEFDIENPLYGFLTCAAEYSSQIPVTLKKLVLGASNNKTVETLLAQILYSTELTTNYVKTTQAVDIFNAGVKSNAIPETTEFTVNYRIAHGSSVNETKQRFLQYANATAYKFGYGLVVENRTLINSTKLGYINVTYDSPLEPSPVSPSSGPTWNLLAGTVENLFVNDYWNEQGLTNNKVYTSSAIVTTNTDSKNYWNVTDTIYRFIGGITNPSILGTVHSVDEHVIVDNHLQSVAFVYEFIVNTNEYGSDIA